MSLWPALPVELKRLVLELVALNDIHDARALRLVSRDINVLVLPVIFQNVSIEHMDDLTAVTSTIFPPPTHYHKLRNTVPEPPRLLSSYNTTSLALLLRENLPSIENALATIGPVFSRLRCLAITSRNLSSNAFWLRANGVRPEYIMLPHHGSPRPVNWRDPIFSQVTHIFTSSLDSHGSSTLSLLKNLTHIAVHTHTELLEDKIRYIAGKLEWLLHPDSFPNLQALVLALGRFPRPPHHKPMRYPHDLVARERYTALLALWRTHLAPCLPSARFFILPDPHAPHAEWETWMHGDAPDMWQQAAAYRLKYPNATVLDPREPELARDLDQWLSLIRVDLLQFEQRAPEKRLARRPSKIEWEIDLVQREGYREFDRLDPEEAGEYEHVLGF